ncbi:hypothetical protein NDU88_001909 [Pleurodeles waltl]|uniref:Uncharacterized protein n=1 Tax=Pleurodeles waltl TaxID=8319 RepID=A0AAV7UY19_PLEWA|nr:hypothetical protein NDU88_001909 [Pleurodeles waltl]
MARAVVTGSVQWNKHHGECGMQECWQLWKRETDVLGRVDGLCRCHGFRAMERAPWRMWNAGGLAVVEKVGAGGTGEGAVIRIYLRIKDLPHFYDSDLS